MRTLLSCLAFLAIWCPRPSFADKCEIGDLSGCTSKCSANDADSCAVLGWMYVDGRGVAVDVDKGVGLIKQSCGARSQRGCLTLALLHEVGKGVPKDEAKAVAQYEKACSSKVMFGCYRLASAYLAGHGVKADAAKAAELLKRACDGGEQSGCLNLGILYDQGRGVAKDHDKAAAIYKAACEAGIGLSCSGLASLYETGRGVQQQLPTARRYYKQACDHFVWPACTKLAQMFAEGLGGPQDDVKSAALFKIACEHADVAACTNAGKTAAVVATTAATCDKLKGTAASGCFNDLGLKYAPSSPVAPGITKDIGKAMELFAKACELGEYAGCANQGAEYFAGTNLPPDVPRGLVLIHKACDAKNAWACDYLKKLPAWAQDPSKLSAWATDGPVDQPGGCKSFWKAVDAQDPPEDTNIKSNTDRALAQVDALKRPTTINERLWRECVKKTRASLEAKRAENDSDKAVGVYRTGVMRGRSSSAGNSSSNNKAAAEMSCKVECNKMCRARAPSDPCMQSINKCKKSCVK